MSSNKQKSRGWYPNKLFKNIGRGNRWNTTIQANFFDSLANLLNIGFSLTEALGFIADTDKQLTSGVIEIQQKLTDGYSFSESIKSMVDAQSYHQLLIAERHGQLREVLAELATFDRLKLKQFKKIHAILVYPLFLCLILLILIVSTK
ncbi:type II secretion system F family protein [Lentilactobacillus sp. TOM.63]|uniref:type II secretion system F family protein n=1 Tax=Lentilactobacillus sp. TOM.63 TaxID=3055077 RepID=UPI0025A0AC1C|nr:type II secretion system F family protein [Lentilactobacillus sp. TOM.63]MDM7516185.1 type II secretion system F family protein [Lentilactobacillus sp. TOM.63]